MAKRGNRTANRSGDGVLVAAVEGQSVIALRIILSCSAAAIVTVRSDDGSGAILLQLDVGPSPVVIGDGDGEVIRTVADEALHVAASTGTLHAHVAYVQE